jgi:hypothetical protein
MRWICSIMLVMVAFLALGGVQPVAADDAPPWYAQGASVEASEAMTNVQMVSEMVVLTVDKMSESETAEWSGIRPMIGRVEATFVMRNQGATEESFEVWFPLVGSAGYDVTQAVRGVPPIKNFAVWVNGIPVPTTQKEGPGPWEKVVPWATWPVTFPPGQDVILRNTYDTVPFVIFPPYGSFSYILETGAGWHGPIGEATIIYRFPYEVNEFTVLHCNGDLFSPPDSATLTISDTDVTWRFTDLEPTSDDNICLAALSQQAWEELTAAQRDVATNPNSPEVHLRLARALVAALPRYLYLPDIILLGNSAALAELAKTSYERALELEPENVDIYVEYLEFLWELTPYNEPLADNFLLTLERALEIAPEDKRLLQFHDRIAERQSYLSTPTSRPTSKAVPTFIPSAMPPQTAGPGPSLAPTPTPTRSPLATQVPAPPLNGGNMSVTALLVLGALLCVLLWGWRVVSLRRKR